MNRRQNRPCRPWLESLEGRVVLSASPIAGPTQASTAHFSIAGLPDLSTNTFGRASRAIDWAFADYAGRHEAVTGTVNTLANYASDLVSSALGSSTSATDSANSNVITDGRGDGVALEARLRRAVDQLPFGNQRLVPLIVQNTSDGGLSPATASLYRDRFKALVRHSLAEGLHAGLFTWNGAAPRHLSVITH